jgi:hypothetical protein
MVPPVKPGNNDIRGSGSVSGVAPTDGQIAFATRRREPGGGYEGAFEHITLPAARPAADPLLAGATAITPIFRRGGEGQRMAAPSKTPSRSAPYESAGRRIRRGLGGRFGPPLGAVRFRSPSSAVVPYAG